MDKLDTLFKELVDQTQERINLYSINNNQHGERAQIEVLKAVKTLYAAYLEIQSKTEVKKSTKSTPKASKKA